MSFISSLFGGAQGDILPMLFALGIVIVLIVLAVWLLKFVFSVSTGVTRGRNRRLAVVDTLALDTRRQLVIVRRDNVEHLILTGGSQDIVVERGIPVEEVAPAPTTRRPVPMVPGRQPARGRTEPPAPAMPANAVERLRERSAPTDQTNQRSLRNTGLLRPVPIQDPGQNTDISPAAPADSAKEGTAGTTRQDGAVDQDPNSEANRG